MLKPRLPGYTPAHLIAISESAVCHFSVVTPVDKTYRLLLQKCLSYATLFSWCYHTGCKLSQLSNMKLVVFVNKCV